MSAFEGLPIFGTGKALYEKSVSNTWEETEVLIAVKAAPQPSEKYGDTVCVAGIRMGEEGPEWIRLYPVPFRSMERLYQFRKYELVRLRVRPEPRDKRPESYRPDRDSLRKVRFLKPWEPRHPYVSPLADKWSMCRIQRVQREGKGNYPTLAAVRPRIVEDLLVERHEGWSPKQHAKVLRDLGQDDLFGDQAPSKPLEEPRFRARYKYRCAEEDCGGHTQTLIDWELDEMVRSRLADRSDEDAIAAVRKRFFEEMCSPDRGPLFFVGNIMATPRAFSVLGVYRTIN